MPRGAGTACDDGEAGTRDDACDGAGGCGGTAFSCALGSCQASSTANGVDCDVVLSEPGTSCDDGDPATSGDVCLDGTCSGSPIGCAPTQCQSTSAPDGAGCAVTFKGAGTACSDGDVTTRSDVCDGSGQCGGTGYTCNVGVCELSSAPDGAGCVVIYEGAGAACNDGDGNTTGDVCDGSGGCSGEPVACAPGACELTSVPDGAGGCAVTTVEDGTSCDDGQLSTMADSCEAGHCAGTDYACPTGACTTANAFDGVGGCIPTFAVFGKSCNDGQVGTRFDQCDGGGGCAGQAYSCPGTQCEDAAPNGVDCVFTPKAQGVGCDDGLAGTKTDVCDGSGGCAGSAYSCPPTECSPSGTPNGVGCDYSHSPGGTACNDGVAATQNDVCDGSGGCAGTPYSCTPGVCASSSAPDGVGCVDTPSMSGTPCNDGLNGTKDDVCNGNFVCAGTSYTCTPGVCQSASVPNGTGCTPTFSPGGTGCNDGNNSTKNDVCNGAGTCSGTAYSCSPTVCQQSSVTNGTGCTIVNKSNGTSCGAGDACHAANQCSNGNCVQGPLNSCGNGQCDCGENPGTCADCPIVRNDGTCGAGENACNSHNDCISATAHAVGHSCSTIGCGGKLIGHCFCDAGCKGFNDCCPDMLEVCGCN